MRSLKARNLWSQRLLNQNTQKGHESVLNLTVGLCVIVNIHKETTDACEVQNTLKLRSMVCSAMAGS